MNDIRRVYLDTNIFIRIFQRHDPIARLLTDMLASDHTKAVPFFATSELTFAELLVQPYRDRDETLIGIYENWMVSNAMLEVGPVTRDALYYAAVLRASHASLKLPDAIHIATAFGFGCSHMLTDDRRISGPVSLSNTRHGITKGPLVLDMLRPDESTLGRIIEAVRA